MTLFTRGRLIAPALFAVTCLLVASADTTVGAMAQKEKKDKKDKDAKEGPGKAAKDLRKAFDAITDFAQSPPPGREVTRVYDDTVRLYREAVSAYAVNPRRTAELAAAANDGARGLEELKRAVARPVPGLPEPPADFARSIGGPKEGPPALTAGPEAEPGPWCEALGELAAVRERLADMDTGIPSTGISRDVTEAAKAMYAQARTAYEAENYRKAAHLARAAEAWSHIPEHLAAAGGDLATGQPLAPPPKTKGPPLPPPALKE